MSEIRYPLPSAMDIAKLLSSLLNTDIRTKECDPWQFIAAPYYNLATYKTDTGNLAVFCITDSVAGASIAGLLSQINVDVVNETIKSNQYTPELLDNIKEIMNILTSLLNSNKTPHLLFQDCQPVLSQIDDERKILLENPIDRLDVKLTIPGYSDGHLLIITTPYKEDSPSCSDWEWVDILVNKL